MCGMPLDDNNFKRPIDINDPNDDFEIRLVESGHISADVLALRKGTSSYEPESDLHYTLRHIPNHYAALDAMGRWRLKHPRPLRPDFLSADCYYERAFTFRPEDPKLRVGYAIYLHRAKRYEDARQQYVKAEELGGDSAELFYNRGLLEVELGNIEVAKQYARKAYSLGYPLPGLRRQLDAAEAKAKKQ